MAVYMANNIQVQFLSQKLLFWDTTSKAAKNDGANFDDILAHTVKRTRGLNKYKTRSIRYLLTYSLLLKHTHTHTHTHTLLKVFQIKICLGKMSFWTQNIKIMTVFGHKLYI